MMPCIGAGGVTTPIWLWHLFGPADPDLGLGEAVRQARSGSDAAPSVAPRPAIRVNGHLVRHATLDLPHLGACAGPRLTSATGGDPSVVELQARGLTWLYVGPACSSLTRCPGWVEIDNNPHTLRVITTPTGIFEFQTGGYLWKYTGVPCSVSGCRGWVLIDRNPNTATVVGGLPGLFEFQAATGFLFAYNGFSTCTPTACPGWTPIDHNPASKTVVVDARAVYEFQGVGVGRLYEYVGPPCPSLTGVCPGWRLIDDNPHTTSVYGGLAGIFELQAAFDAPQRYHSTGLLYAYNGTSACGPNGCPGWTAIDRPEQIPPGWSPDRSVEHPGVPSGC
jgi:hypothetical protein